MVVATHQFDHCWLVPEQLVEFVSGIQQALDTDGIWIGGEGTAIIYRRLEP